LSVAAEVMGGAQGQRPFELLPPRDPLAPAPAPDLEDWQREMAGALVMRPRGERGEDF
jgi:hypothetical protein